METDNACKASEKQGIIFVQGKVLKDRYQILVKDNGYGIPENEIKRVLDPFYMVDKSRTRSQGGAGLGLSLCNKIIQIHGGSMQIESKVQVGTTVSIVLDTSRKEGGVNEEIQRNQ